jgi:F-type H+-transporting ATPase subunit b
MIFDSTFWVAISFLIFLGVLIYFKVHEKINNSLNEIIRTIRGEVDSAEGLKEESKNILSEYEKKISNAKAEVKIMLNEAADEAEKHVLKTNEEFHVQVENRKKNAEDRIKQMKKQALSDVKNTSVKIAINSVESLLKNSLDKNKLNKIFTASVEETKLALNKKSS